MIPASKVYVGGKKKAAEEVGFNGIEIHMPATSTHQEVLDRCSALNEDPSVHGILVQLPLPKQVNADAIIASIDPAKDVDGFHPINAGNLFMGRPGAAPLHAVRGDAADRRRPVRRWRQARRGDGAQQHRRQADGDDAAAGDATVTICHRKSDLKKELAELTSWWPRSVSPG